MLYNPSLQKIINAVVILLLVASAAIAVVGFLPSRSPLGPLIGKLSNTKTLSGLIGALDPRAVGEALKDNPQFLVEVMR